MRREDTGCPDEVMGTETGTVRRGAETEKRNGTYYKELWGEEIVDTTIIVEGNW